MNENESSPFPVQSAKPGSWRGRATGAGLVAGGLLIGAVLTDTIAANADTSADTSTPTLSSTATTPDTTSPEAGVPDVAVDPSQPQRADEELLTGDALTQVIEAALAEYPGATIERVETDSDGVYEAHLITADGERVTVEFDADYAVTGTEAGHGPGGRGHDDLSNRVVRGRRLSPCRHPGARPRTSPIGVAAVSVHRRECRCEANSCEA